MKNFYKSLAGALTQIAVPVSKITKKIASIPSKRGTRSRAFIILLSGFAIWGLPFLESAYLDSFLKQEVFDLIAAIQAFI